MKRRVQSFKILNKMNSNGKEHFQSWYLDTWNAVLLDRDVINIYSTPVCRDSFCFRNVLSNMENIN